MMKKNKNKDDEEEGLKTRNNRRFFKMVLKECNSRNFEQ